MLGFGSRKKIQIIVTNYNADADRVSRGVIRQLQLVDKDGGAVYELDPVEGSRTWFSFEGTQCRPENGGIGIVSPPSQYHYQLASRNIKVSPKETYTLHYSMEEREGRLSLGVLDAKTQGWVIPPQAYPPSGTLFLDFSSDEKTRRLSGLSANRPGEPGHAEIFFRDIEGVFEPVLEDEIHLRAALDWLLASQEAGGGKGYAAAYTFNHGWTGPYPETSGYIVTTMWKAYGLLGDERYRDSALKAANWLVDIRMPSGAIQAGYDDASGFWDKDLMVPAVFNTGQVVQGWNRTYLETRDEAFLEASIKASEYIVSALDGNGVFREGLSPGPTNLERSYYTRAAYAMIWTGRLCGREEFVEAGRRHMDWVLTRQKENGFVEGAEFHTGALPLTHTMAYVCEGLLYAGSLLDDEKYILASRRLAEAVMMTCERRGFFLPASLDADFTSSEKGSCLTGNAQFARLWLSHGCLADDLPLINSGLKMVDWLKGVQSLENENPGIRGGIAGDWPIDGSYSSFRYVNWAAKFFADALMRAMTIKDRMRNGG